MQLGIDIGTGRGLRLKAIAALRPLLRTPLFLVLSAAYLIPFVWILHRSLDQGTIMYGALRVSEGAIPGRDFCEVMGPGSFYWLGLFFKLFGPGWQVTRAVLLFTGVATAGLLYDIARQVCHESVAVFLWLFVLVIGIPLFPVVSHHWDSNFFAIVALWCYLKLEINGHSYWAVAAGTLAGVTSCFMLHKGLLLLLALLASAALRQLWPRTCVATPGSNPRPPGKYATWTVIWLLSGSFASVGIGVLLAYWKVGALGELWYANVIWPLFGYHGLNVVPYGQSLVAVAVRPVAQVVGPHWIPPILMLGTASLIPFLVIATLPLLAAASSLACLFAASARHRWLGGPLLGIALGGGALWVSELHRKDIFHLIFGAPVLLIVLFASISLVLDSRIGKAFVGLVVAGLVVFGTLNLMRLRTEIHGVETRRGTLMSSSSEADDGALRFLCTAVKRREFVFIYPYYPNYYYLADVTNPTRFSLLLYGYNTPEQFDEVIRNLEEKCVRYVLWDSEVYGDKLTTFLPSYRHPSGDKLKLEQYLNTRYDMIAVKGRFRILQRRGQAGPTPSLPALLNNSRPPQAAPHAASR